MTFWPAEPGWTPLRDIDYLDTIYEFVEIFEFAARLALSSAGGVPCMSRSIWSISRIADS